MTTRLITRTGRAAADLAAIVAYVAAENHHAARRLGELFYAKLQLLAPVQDDRIRRVERDCSRSASI